MKLGKIEILEKENNRKGDLFGRLMADLFHALGYDEPRLNVSKSGRELDLLAQHRTERKIAIAECKAQKEPVGGSAISKFVGVLDAEKRSDGRKKRARPDKVGYFVSLSGFTETAVQQEEDVGNDRVILIKPAKIVEELIKGRILVPIAIAVSSLHSIPDTLLLCKQVDLFAYERGWIWVIYYSNNGTQKATHFALVHAEGKPLLKELATEIVDLDVKSSNILGGLELIDASAQDSSPSNRHEVESKYFAYLENECGEIQFEGLPTDRDAGSVRVKLENIFVPIHLNRIRDKNETDTENEDTVREQIGDILRKHRKLAILAKPGGGKSTLIKRIAIAYAFPERLKVVDDNLPENKWFPIFLRCRELGTNVNLSITEIISNIPARAEIKHCTKQFEELVSNALQKGSALLLIDGLDEISEDRDRINFVNQLRTFIATYPNINIIVTSREAGFRVVAGSLATYCAHYKLASLSESEILDLTVRWHRAIIDDSNKTLEEASGLGMLILGDNRIRVLAENPLLLTTLLFVKRWVGYLPTKRSVLYQEMIKLLLVSWNVEGHEKLDIDETEPQLAYVAFWMTNEGRQTISEAELKLCLIAARKQLPDILGYSKISVPNFIKSVEARSSLLIMTGHVRDDTGQISPVYEFLHLSFQEYLTAKAIAENYLPEDEQDVQILSILKPRLSKENWKEVIPLVAVLAKKENKNLIQYLTDESKSIASKTNKDDTLSYIPSLLGQCIANEIQISPSMLDDAIEWYAKNYMAYGSKQLQETILNSKFCDIYVNKVKECFFGEKQDDFFDQLTLSLSEISFRRLDLSDVMKSLKTTLTELRQNDSSEQCMAMLGFTLYAFHYRMSNFKAGDVEEVQFRQIYSQILIFSKRTDIQTLYCFTWCLTWLNEIYELSETDRSKLVNTILKSWIALENGPLFRMLTWTLTIFLRPTSKIESSMHEDIIKIITRINKLEKQSKIEQIVALFFAYLLGLPWNKSQAKPVLKMSPHPDKQGVSLGLFAKAMNVTITK